MKPTIILPFYLKFGMVLLSLIALFYVAILGKCILAGAFLAIPVIAITKIICERIDGLKPWSILLGDERDEKPPMPLKVKIKENKQIKSLQT